MASSMPISPGEDAAPRGGRRVHPLQREDEQRRRDDVDVVDQVRPLLLRLARFLNIFSMRSVIRNPLTMLVTAAVMAMKPSTLLSSGGVARRR